VRYRVRGITYKPYDLILISCLHFPKIVFIHLKKYIRLYIYQTSCNIALSQPKCWSIKNMFIVTSTTTYTLLRIRSHKCNDMTKKNIHVYSYKGNNYYRYMFSIIHFYTYSHAQKDGYTIVKCIRQILKVCLPYVKDIMLRLSYGGKRIVVEVPYLW
jgi:hypothetical protein